MEREHWDSDPTVESDLGSPTSSSSISDTKEAQTADLSVQSMARDLNPTLRATDYEAAELEELMRTDSEIANKDISASVAEIELREKMGFVRFELFKQVQSTGISRAAEDFKRQYRALLRTTDKSSEDRFARIRGGVAKIASELWVDLLRGIAHDERTKKACAGDKELLKEALRTVEPRLFAEFSRVSDAEENEFHAQGTSK